jgi:hypothetical protein
VSIPNADVTLLADQRLDPAQRPPPVGGGPEDLVIEKAAWLGPTLATFLIR